MEYKREKIMPEGELTEEYIFKIQNAGFKAMESGELPHIKDEEGRIFVNPADVINWVRSSGMYFPPALEAIFWIVTKEMRDEREARGC